jgi:hypothetical protein
MGSGGSTLNADEFINRCIRDDSTYKDYWIDSDKKNTYPTFWPPRHNNYIHGEPRNIIFGIINGFPIVGLDRQYPNFPAVNYLDVDAPSKELMGMMAEIQEFYRIWYDSVNKKNVSMIYDYVKSMFEAGKDIIFPYLEKNFAPSVELFWFIRL